jgi:hypothetical protein
VQGVESLAFHRSRVSSNRGNAYLPPVLPSAVQAQYLIQPNWDCKPSNGPVKPRPGTPSGTVGCFMDANTLWKGSRARRFTHVEREDYGGR